MPTDAVVEWVARVLAGIPNVTVHHDPEPMGPTSGAFLAINSVELCPALADLLASEYPAGFFRHQGLVIDHILSGTNTIVATQTSSGKSLIYSAPVFSSILSDP